MSKIELKNGEIISTELLSAIREAMPDDIEYEKMIVDCHPMRPEKKSEIGLHT